MANIKKYNGSTWENTTARKYETKSEIIVPPTTIYCDGNNATLSIKGNTVQNGTPTPSSPVPVLGVGELVGSDYQIPISNGQQTTNINLGSTPLDKNGTAVDTIEDNTLYKVTNRSVLTGSENWTLQSINQYGIANFYLANVLTA
jgi:hypothetical protein